MKANQKWFTALELSGMPGMPGTTEGVLRRVKKQLYVSRKRAYGKGFEYALSNLPTMTQAYLNDVAAADEKARGFKEKEAAAPVEQAQANPQTEELLTLLRQIAADISAIKKDGDHAIRGSGTLLFS